MTSWDFENLKKYLDENYIEEVEVGDQALEFLTDNNLKNIFTDIGASLFASTLLGAHIPKSSYSAKPDRDKSDKGKNGVELSDKEKLSLWLNQQMRDTDSFQEKLRYYMKEKGYADHPPKLYNKIYLDRRVFSRISSEAYGVQPEKKTVFKLIIGLELNLSESGELLESSGFSFNCHKKFDMIIKYCIEKKIYDLRSIDEYLVKFDEKPLFSIE